MTVEETELPGVLLITPKSFGDSRGYFLESYHEARYREAGIECGFVQDNVSHSGPGVLRGLHFQVPNGQAKLIQVLSGEILDVAVDIRFGSPHFGKWVGRILSDQNHAQLFIPAGFAHGFAVLGDHATVAYKCSVLYEAAGDSTILWNDPEIGIEWPVQSPVLSAKDQAGLTLAQYPVERLPKYES